MPFGMSTQMAVDVVLGVSTAVTLLVGGAPGWTWALLVLILSRTSAVGSAEDLANVTESLRITRKSIDERDQRIAVDVTNRLLMQAAEREANQR